MTNNSKKLTGVLGIVGAGGHGRETMDQVKNFTIKENPEIEVNNFFFIESEKSQEAINDVGVLNFDEFFDLPDANKFFNIAISDHAIRKKIAEEFEAHGCMPMEIRSSLASIGSSNIIDKGALISQFALITTNIKIGKFLHLNRHASISHDCVIGDYVTFAPYATTSGNVRINDGAYIGAGAIIKQGSTSCPLIIGKDAIVGMGAIVTKDVPENFIVAGNPAKKIN